MAHPAVTDFLRALDSFDRSKTRTEIFRIFCEMAYCALAKRASPFAGQRDRLEAEYMCCVGMFPNKDDVRRMPDMMGLAIQTIAAGGVDFFGQVAAEIGALDARLGQFFTPYEVSRMLAEMSLGDVSAQIEAQGFITISEPAAGYSDAEVESLIAGCEMKIYISPNDHSTTEEITKALGTRTGFKASYSYTLNDFSNRSVNVSTEELPLFTAAQLRGLPKSKVLLMPEGHQPILADKIVYYADPVFKPIFESQKGAYPYPSRQLQHIDRLEQQVVRTAVENRQMREALAEAQNFKPDVKPDRQTPARAPDPEARGELDDQMATIEETIEIDKQEAAAQLAAMNEKLAKKMGGGA